jgi:hypothetical protein
MRQLTNSCFLIAAMALAVAAEPMGLDYDAAVLAGSPWVNRARVAILPERGEAQLRDGGRMGGGGKRAGLGKLRTYPGTLELRWESAAPVRVAETKIGEAGLPDWIGDFYAIAVFGVPGITRGNEKGLRSELKQTTCLRRAGKKDLKPVRVEITVLDNNTARILYLFPRAAGITLTDQRVEFVSRIGRISVGSSFNLSDMILQGKLEL